jgi:class 3 adenylate cyclase/CHASE2 domain-containing sensor protein
MLWKRRLAEILVVLLTAAAAVAITQWMPFVAMMENWLSDYRIATLSPPQPQSADIVIVTITEDTLQLFPYRSPLDRRFVASVLKALDNAGAKVIGVDLLFDQATEPAKDEELKATIQNLRTPLVIGIIGEQEGLNDDQQDFLADFVPTDRRAYVTLVKDGIDSTVRRMYPGRMDPNGTFIKGFPLVVLEKIGHHCEAQTIAWRGPPGNGLPSFRKFPAHTLKLIPSELFKDKIVLVGADLTLTDRHRTPLATVSGGYSLIPGIEIHAHAIDQLLSGRNPETLSLANKFVFALAVSALGVLLAQLGLRLSINLSLAVALVAMIWISGFILFREKTIMIPLVMPTLALSGAWWATGIHGNWQEKRQKKFLTEAFSRYMSPDLVKELVAYPEKLALGGERREMTFLFSDVARFTTLSERIEPGILGSLLNGYFNGLCQIIIGEGGTVIDFVGDAVFAIFGAPIAQPDHAARAIACASRIHQYSEEFRKSDAASQWNWGETRLGVHTGFALVGNFGSDLKFKYAPVGDAVNTGSRLEGLNKYFGTTVCLSETAVAASGITLVRLLGRCVMKGKSEPISVYEPMPAEWFTSPAGIKYKNAYERMASGKTSEALTIFQEMAIEHPEDTSAKFHLSRLQNGATDDMVVMLDK